MPLSSTRIGAIGENPLVNAVMMASDGRLSPFQPLADDDGLDVLFYDKKTGDSVAIQLKCRTTPIRKRNSGARGNVVHFQIRQTTFNDARLSYLVAALFDEELTRFAATWFIPMALLPEVGKGISGTTGSYVRARQPIALTATRHTDVFERTSWHDPSLAFVKRTVPLPFCRRLRA
jgi:hypothetical protein